ncbi:MAG TPA: hypothetical protein VFW17_00665 [Ktedonobacterales bacterium]|jgi:uncharacterized membrane protein|nr:hypothetical protein [Ktedonobacterales bacterium]
MGDQPNYGQPMQPQSAGAKWGPTAIGSLEAHIVAGLGYFFTPVLPFIFFLMEKTNKFVRFHAMQSMILGVVAIAWYVIVVIINSIIFAASLADTSGTVSTVGTLGSCLIGCLYIVGGLGLFGLWLWGIISAFTGKYQKLPVIGNLAEKWAGGPAQPAY